MKIRPGSNASLGGLVSLIVLYVLLIALVLVFANQILSDVSLAESPASTLVIIVAIAFPVFLLVTVVLNIVRLFRQRQRGRPGVAFKLRLLGFFFVIVILSSVPQGILSVNFISSAMNSWFSSRTGEALQGGLDIALTYYDEKVEQLGNFADSPVFRSLLGGVQTSPRRTWENIQTVNPALDAFQVFDESFHGVFAAGQEAARITAAQVRNAQNGLVSRDSTTSASFLWIRTTYDAGYTRFYVVLSVMLPDGFDAKAQLLTTSLETFGQLDRLRQVFLAAIILFYGFFSLPLLLLAVMVSFVLSDEIIRPIENLEEATRRVAEGDYSFRILTRTHDDLGLLVASFNKMVSELERSRTKILQTEKVSAWQEIAQRLAHEIKNPLTPIRLSAERILRKYQNKSEDFDAVFERSIRSIIAEVDGLNTLLSEFRNFSRLPEPEKVVTPLKQLVSEVVSTYSAQTEGRIHFDAIDEALQVPLDPTQMKQVFANLFKNALDAMEGSGDIFVRSDLVKKGNSNYCRIQVEDTGPGIESEHHSKVFNPYFTTKKHGTGLGLSIVERIVFDHKGQIWFETQPGAGTTFFIDLPAEL